MQHTLFITGASGYVGAMLAHEFAKRGDVARIIGLDMEAASELCRDEPKYTHIQMNTAERGWEEEVRKFQPDIVIHCAWQIREMYGQQNLEWLWNVGGSARVFDFALHEPSIKRLVYFSTVASYGAFAGNTIEHRFIEEEPFRTSEYLYAEEKRVVEESLAAKVAKASRPDLAVAVVRPAAITGPRGRFMRIRFGLQSALSGQLRGSVAYSIVSKLTAFVPVTSQWCRQFIHEDDVVAITETLAFGQLKNKYDVFNLCPPGDVVRGADMARAVGKRLMRMPPFVIRVAFFCMWHATRGKVPTGRGAWRGYSYPIVVDGGKLTRLYGYQYATNSYDAFYYTNGRYEEWVPEASRRRKEQ